MSPLMPGAPAWVDLGTGDLLDAVRFYTKLFGWTAEVGGAEHGGYTTFALQGRVVAGAGPLFDPGQPTAWSTYLGTGDADAVAARVTDAGGQVLVQPFDVGDQGRMAAMLDPTGATFSVWEPGTLPGAAVFDVPGALTWNELNTRDLGDSAAFYGDVFGWAFRTTTLNAQPYLVAKVGTTPVCGIQPMVGAGWPDDMSPHWMVYFRVHDCERTAAHARALGGQVRRAPAALDVGRYAILSDPQGGIFAVLSGRR